MTNTLILARGMAAFVAASLSFPFSLALASEPAPDKPSVLFCSPSGVGHGYVDLTYLKELREAGIEVDYTERSDDFTWERFQKFNALVIYAGPENPHTHATKLTSEKFVELLEQFLKAGGGVLAMVPEAHTDKAMMPAALLQRWGAQIPLERIREKDPGHVAMMSHMNTPLAFTSEVAESPMSKGVRQIWYPYSDAYNAQATLPLWLDDHWQVVVRASPTSVTEPVDMSKSGLVPLAKPFVRPGPTVSSPPIFAVRPYQAGRIAFLSQWPQYSVGSGTKWLFHREVLNRGLEGKQLQRGRIRRRTRTRVKEQPLADIRPGQQLEVALPGNVALDAPVRRDQSLALRRTADRRVAGLSSRDQLRRTGIRHRSHGDALAVDAAFGGRLEGGAHL